MKIRITIGRIAGYLLLLLILRTKTLSDYKEYLDIFFLIGCAYCAYGMFKKGHRVLSALYVVLAILYLWMFYVEISFACGFLMAFVYLYLLCNPTYNWLDEEKEKKEEKKEKEE